MSNVSPNDSSRKKRLRQSSILETFLKKCKTEMPMENLKENLEPLNIQSSSQSTIQILTSSDNESESNIKMLEPVLKELEQSPDLFPDNGDNEETNVIQLSSVENFSPCSTFELTPKVLEYSIDETCLKRSPGCLGILPPLRPTYNHKILFNFNLTVNSTPRPYPITYKDKWDRDHVRLPCSANNLYPYKENGSEIIVPRWELIKKNLSRAIQSAIDLEEAILSYNISHADKWNFEELHRLFANELTEIEVSNFFANLLPKMIELALDLPKICTAPLPLLKKRLNLSITISQYQASCLLANAFFCTFPRRNAQYQTSEYATYPDINFNRLFGQKGLVYKDEKLRCILNYFNRVTAKKPTGVLTYERCYCEVFPNWQYRADKLSRVIVDSEGMIEKEGSGLLQVDFANKMVGGGVLGQGCVQEEIRFLICPELILARLFTESLEDSEVLLVTGCEQYNKYTGYADTFEWAGDYRDETPRDSWGRCVTEVVAMDAFDFHHKDLQYRSSYIARELNKAYCAFQTPKGTPKENLQSVATGNWGCGAFKGDPRLKFVIQLMAASAARRDLLYFTYGDVELKNDIECIYQCVSKKGALVSDLWTMVSKYKEFCGSEYNLYAYMFDYDIKPYVEKQ